MRIGLVVPHIFMHQAILPKVIFSPGALALALAEGLQQTGVEVTLFTPGPVDTTVPNSTADLHYFEQELAGRGDSYIDLLKKHPFTFVTLARQVQSELIARAFAMANNDQLDVVHIYTNEEDIALPFAALCTKPVVFTHHDPFNFLIKYKNLFPKYKQLNWISLSFAQRRGMPPDTNWVGNVYHGLAADALKPAVQPTADYVLYMGRIIEPKGVHLAIAAAQQAGIKLKIAGKHYAGVKDAYWKEHIEPQLAATRAEYVGFVNDEQAKQTLLANARALVVPSTFEEPFGMVVIEALACGTPVIGLDSGAIPEIIQNNQTGLIVPRAGTEEQTIAALATALTNTATINRATCRQAFLTRFTLDRMCQEHAKIYHQLVANV